MDFAVSVSDLNHIYRKILKQVQDDALMFVVCE